MEKISKSQNQVPPRTTMFVVVVWFWREMMECDTNDHLVKQVWLPLFFFLCILGIQGHVVGQQYFKYVWVDNNMSGPWPCPKSHRISSRYHVCIHSLMHNIKLHLKQHGCKYFVSFVVGVTFNFYFILYIYLLAHFVNCEKIHQFVLLHDALAFGF